jgi:hypothetical protein
MFSASLRSAVSQHVLFRPYSTLIRKIPAFNDLSPLWQNFFAKASQDFEEDFWCSLSRFKDAYSKHDSFATQLSLMGNRFDEGREAPVTFYQTAKWALEQLGDLVRHNYVKESDVLVPGKAFVVEENGVKKNIFVCLGGYVPPHATELNLLPPDVFAEMLSQGFFPIGASEREHTNQTLCEHDMAHIAGFISCPEYMKAVRNAFQVVGKKMETNPAVKKALENFDSLYSLRLYYMIEIFSIIPAKNVLLLEDLLKLNVSDFSLDKPEAIYPNVIQFLKSKSPVELSRYLYRVYEGFPQIVNPLGGESRDILNRTRKFSRSNQAGSFYAKMSNLDSKFDGSSIYSLWLNARAALENKRSNHKDYQKSISLIHAPVIASLLGTSQLTIHDWVKAAVEEVPDKQSKMYKYICETGLWNKSHVLFWAYGHSDFSKILKKDDFDPKVAQQNTGPRPY